MQGKVINLLNLFSFCISVISINKKMLNINPELSEVCGIHAGDGYLRNDGQRREIDISGSIEEKDYYDRHVAPLFGRVFNIKIKNRVFFSRGTYGFVIRDRKIVEFLHNLGFPYGKKSTTVKIPKLILKSKNKLIYVRFLRGLFDTDGNINFRKSYGKYIKFKKKYPHYPRVTLTTVSKSLSDHLQLLLKKVGFKPYCHIYKSKNMNEKRRYIIEINGIEQINKWIKIIGIKNNVKFSRYLIWKRFGFCPTNTTFKQRKGILNGKNKLL